MNEWHGAFSVSHQAVVCTTVATEAVGGTIRSRRSSIEAVPLAQVNHESRPETPSSGSSHSSGPPPIGQLSTRTLARIESSASLREPSSFWRLASLARNRIHTSGGR
jgi:hypothetical protein